MFTHRSTLNRVVIGWNSWSKSCSSIVFETFLKTFTLKFHHIPHKTYLNQFFSYHTIYPPYIHLNVYWLSFGMQIKKLEWHTLLPSLPKHFYDLFYPEISKVPLSFYLGKEPPTFHRSIFCYCYLGLWLYQSFSFG